MIVLRKIQTQTSIIIGKALTPQPNGVIDIFQTPHSFKDSSITITWNGQSLYSPEDFKILNNTTIQFICDSIYLPKTSDILRATYERL